MGSDGVPADVIEYMKSVSVHCKQVECNVRDILAAYDPDVLSELPPLDRVYTFLTLAKAVATLYTLQLQCSGESPDDHPFKKELERLELYTNKLEYYIDMSKARPTIKINARAATRFIEHSLPDLTPEQRNDMHNVSKGQGTWSKSQKAHGNKKKRKHELSGKQSVATAAAVFLAETSKELFGGSSPGEQVEMSEEGEIGDD